MRICAMTTLSLVTAIAPHTGIIIKNSHFS